MSNSEHYQCFIRAIRGGSIKLFHRFFKREYLEREDLNKKRPIHHACECGQVEIVRLLIDHKCDIEACDKSRWRPIHHACWEGHTETASLLICRHCDSEAMDKWGWKPINYASMARRTKTIQMLNTHSYSTPAQSGELPSRPIIHIDNGPRLLRACENGDLRSFLEFLNDVTIEYCDENKRRPIHWACEKEKIQIVQLLIERKCNIFARDKYDLSPLDIAKRKKNQKLVNIIQARETEMQLDEQIFKMGLECRWGCDHKLCKKSIREKNFEKGSKIGSGSFGEVFKCKGSGIPTVFAIKYLILEFIDSKYIEGDIHKFMPKLNNERIIQYYGVIQTKTHLCIFMEYLPQSIEEKINKNGPLETQDVVRYSKQILEGLEFLHNERIIHRDIKPANILLNQENCVKLTDFGVSRLLSGELSNPTTVCGTPHFMAPEVILADTNGPYNTSADIWSVGATVINMITGHPPNHKKRPEDVLNEIENDKKLQLPSSELMSKEMKTFIEKMMNPDPNERPTATELLTLSLFS